MKTLKPFLFGAARLRFFNIVNARFHFSHLALCLDNAPLALLSRLGRFLFFLVGVGFLLIALTACAGGGGGSGGSSGGSMNNGSMNNSSMGDGTGNGGSSSMDDDNDGIANANDNCPDVANSDQLDTDGDRAGDACDDDDDNDGLDDTDTREQQSNSANVRCSLLVDCDGDSVRDIDEVAAACVIKADCDDDGARDGDEEVGCVQNTDCDNDGVGDGIEARGCAKLANCDGDSSEDGTDIDDDGDGLIEIRTHEELNSVRHALDGTGRKLSESGTLNQTGCGDGTDITSCSGYELVADISLASYANADNGKGWQPLGNDTDPSTTDCQGDPFDGIFEGNGWTISDLNIDRSGQDCVGLFGHLDASSEIRNLTLRAEAVIGKNQVGGLVGSGLSVQFHSCSVVVVEVSGGQNTGGLIGWGNSARIHSSSVVVGEVSGGAGNWVGGLVGQGSFARIHYSSVVAGEVRGDNHIGGLVGIGESAQIHSSSVVAGEVRGSGNLAQSGNAVGGLIGAGHSARIHSSSVVVGEVSGTGRGGKNVGGLTGWSGSGRIVSSSIVVGELSGKSDVGGLTGNLGSGKVAYSYVVSGSNTNMLAGAGSGTGNASYWDSETSGRGNGNHGEAKTSNDLRGPDDYEGIYENWDEDMDIFGDEDEPLAVWCDRDNSGSIEMDEKIDANLIWDFGTSSQYPAIRCTPLDPDGWRDWWSLEGTPAKPTLNRDRLDQLLP